MKTVFKVGMEVYDYAYGKGEVIEVQNYRFLDNILLVKFEDRDAFVKYSLDGRLINYKSCGGELAPENVATNPTLSISPYKLEGFRQAPTFGEALKWLRDEHLDECITYKIYNEKDFVDYYYSKNAPYKSFEALRRLIILRDYYNEGWEPDWNDDTTKYVIKCVSGDLSDSISICVSYTMNFKSQEIAKKFIKEQRELLEIAKPLL